MAGWLVRIDADEIDLGDDYVWRHQGRPFTGTAEERTADGVLLHENEFRDGTLDGLGRTYWPDGTRRQEHWYDHGTKLRERHWYMTGQLREDIVTDARRLAKHFTWAEDGTLTSSQVTGLSD